MPTAMLYRNLMAMDVEEMIRSNPLDGVVLLCGCDKTTPAQFMGAASVDVPAIMLPAGPMLSGRWRDQQLGSGTDLWKFWDERRAGRLSEREWHELEGCYSRSPGTCNTMGTASTMTSLAEAMGMMLPGAASIPAPDSRRLACAEATGRTHRGSSQGRPSAFPGLDARSIRECYSSPRSPGGINQRDHSPYCHRGAPRPDLPLSLFDELRGPRPSLLTSAFGEIPHGGFLLCRRLARRGAGVAAAAAPGCADRDGKTLAESVREATCSNRDVIRPFSQPLHAEGSLAVLHGNLAPQGAVIKTSAATPRFSNTRAAPWCSRTTRKCSPRGRFRARRGRIERAGPQNAGPVGAPGMPEWGMLPIPAKLLRQGVSDMVRISDARMSGTSFGTVVLHISPEAAIGGPLAIVRSGDEIRLDVPARRLDLLVDEAEIKRRRPPDLLLRHVSGAAITRCSWIMFYRPTKVVISISCERARTMFLTSRKSAGPEKLRSVMEKGSSGRAEPAHPRGAPGLGHRLRRAASRRAVRGERRIPVIPSPAYMRGMRSEVSRCR